MRDSDIYRYIDIYMNVILINVVWDIQDQRPVP